jgi:hypothetical protein
MIVKKSLELEQTVRKAVLDPAMPPDNRDPGWRHTSAAVRGLSHPCPDHGRREAAEPQQWISVHRTS